MRSWMFDVAAVRAAAGLLDPAGLRQVVEEQVPIWTTVADWLDWLLGLPPLPPSGSG